MDSTSPGDGGCPVDGHHGALVDSEEPRTAVFWRQWREQ
jgi:hypothetical protein